MSRAKQARLPAQFAMLPVDVLEAEAWRSLTHAARSTLTVLCAQYRGKHNGHLLLTPKICERFGLNYDQAKRDVAELVRRGLVVMTCQGGRKPKPPTQYAVGWREITHRHNALLECAEKPTNAWAVWMPCEISSQRTTRIHSERTAESWFRNSAQNADGEASDSAHNADLIRSGFGGDR